MSKDKSNDLGYLTGKLLVAMPNLHDSWFERSVIYICSHDEDGAMGLVINKENDEVSSHDIAKQLDLPNPSVPKLGVLRHGGPVEEQRGFVLHSTDFEQETTVNVASEFALTATVDILKKIANNDGPESFIVALGYSGWDAGQLDQEIQQNSWLSVEADKSLVFSTALDKLWTEAIGKLGITAASLSSDWGHA